MWVTPWCLLWLWGHRPWPHTQIALVSRADPGIMGAQPPGPGLDGQQDARKGRPRGGEGDAFSFPAPPPTVCKEAGGHLGKGDAFGIQTGQGSKLVLLQVHGPQTPHLQNGNHNSYLTGLL